MRARAKISRETPIDSVPGTERLAVRECTWRTAPFAVARVTENSRASVPRTGRSPNRRFFAASIAIVAVALGSGLAGCGSKPEPKVPPTEISVQVLAAPDANQDAAGRALPIVVRVYELKSTGGFEGADFFTLYNKDDATLGADMLARDELTLQPGSSRSIDRPADPAAGFLGVVAAFRDIDKSAWRATYVLKPNIVNRVSVQIGADSVSIRGR